MLTYPAEFLCINIRYYIKINIINTTQNVNILIMRKRSNVTSKII